MALIFKVVCHGLIKWAAAKYATRLVCQLSLAFAHFIYDICIRFFRMKNEMNMRASIKILLGLTNISNCKSLFHIFLLPGIFVPLLLLILFGINATCAAHFSCCCYCCRRDSVFFVFIILRYAFFYFPRSFSVCFCAQPAAASGNIFNLLNGAFSQLKCHISYS